MSQRKQSVVGGARNDLASVGLVFDGVTYHGVEALAHRFGADAIDVRDLTGNGLLDIAFCGNDSPRFPVGVCLLLQIAKHVFQLVIIDENSSPTLTDRFHQLEGCSFADIDGDGIHELLVVDQEGNDFYIYKPENGSDYAGNWNRVKINQGFGRPFGQDSFAYDFDGDGVEEVAIAFEGTTDGDEIAAGGVVWYDFPDPNADPLDPASYVEYVLARRRGSWSFLKSKKFMTIDSEECLIFGSRFGHNDFAAPGILKAVRPAVVTDEWEVTEIYSTVADDITWIDAGDFSGDGHGDDIAFIQWKAVEDSDSLRIRYLDKGDSWNEVLMGSALGQPYNAVALEAAMRTALIVPESKVGVFAWHWTGAAWQRTLLFPIGYGHPLDEPREPIVDLYQDGRRILLMPDSGGHKLLALAFSAL